MDQVIERLSQFIAERLKDDSKATLVVTSMVEFNALKQILKHHPVGEKIEDFGTENAAHFTLNLADLAICPKCDQLSANRDQDVFDTWFSSGQWPFATLMSQDSPQDFKKFYPTSVMETGYDIIFFWVARMIMLGKYKTQKVPFRKIYLNGLVRDQDRQKMSKSKGNVVEPLGIAEAYGTDAVRMALVFGVSAGSDIIINEQQIKGMRNFANKVWNIGRFILTNLDQDEGFKYEQKPNRITEADVEILNQLSQTTRSVRAHIEDYRFHEAAQEIYGFIWNHLADIYLEKSKAQLDDQKLTNSTLNILLFNLTTSLKLLHPFMPYVTEALWQELFQRQYVSDKILITTRFPD
jgi:valyl-tRNA synthetase